MLSLISDFIKENAPQVNVKYIDCEPYIKFEKYGDWIDLRSRVILDYKKGDYVKVPLGVAMKIPDCYEAYVAARSSTFKNFGLIPTNGFGIIDSSYCGDKDEWCFLGYAIRDGHIAKGDRLCQFRFVANMPFVNFSSVDSLGGVSRGGFGSTGIK